MWTERGNIFTSYSYVRCGYCCLFDNHVKLGLYIPRFHIPGVYIWEVNQPQAENTWGKKSRKFQKGNFNLPHFSNHFYSIYIFDSSHSIYTVIGIISNLERIWSAQEDVYLLHANTIPFYERLKHLWILVSTGVLKPISLRFRRMIALLHYFSILNAKKKKADQKASGIPKEWTTKVELNTWRQRVEKLFAGLEGLKWDLLAPSIMNSLTQDWQDAFIMPHLSHT